MDIYNKETYFYELPQELIAQEPIEPRDHSRLMVYNSKKDEVNHRHFYDVIDYLNKGDVLVVNNTKVVPARLFGVKVDTGAKVEVFILKRLDLERAEVLCKPAKRLKVGTVVTFGDTLQCEVLEEHDGGIRIVKFIYEGVFEEVLLKVGNVPLPHYIKNEKYNNLERYNTVYSKTNGSAAAPTAGLHFTTELMQKIADKGVIIANVLLHVGLGTFRPVSESNILNHDMHSEYIEISAETCDVINQAKASGNKVVAVGTTSVRVLETAADDNGVLHPITTNTNIFIYPGYKWKVVDGLITNFHLPESTLIMLVSAFLSIEKTLELYNLAVKEKYRFFSFGDSTLLLR